MAEGEALCTLIIKQKKGPTRETDMKVANTNTGSESHIEPIRVIPPPYFQNHIIIICIPWLLIAHCNAGEASLMMSVRMTSGSRLGAIIRSCKRSLLSALNSHSVLQGAWGNIDLRQRLKITSIPLSLGLSMRPCLPAMVFAHEAHLHRFGDDASHAGAQPAPEEVEARRAQHAMHMAQHPQPNTRRGVSRAL